jgi:hypothetical protein
VCKCAKMCRDKEEGMLTERRQNNSLSERKYGGSIAVVYVDVQVFLSTVVQRQRRKGKEKKGER